MTLKERGYWSKKSRVTARKRISWAQWTICFNRLCVTGYIYYEVVTVGTFVCIWMSSRSFRELHTATIHSRGKFAAWSTSWQKEKPRWQRLYIAIRANSAGELSQLVSGDDDDEAQRSAAFSLLLRPLYREQLITQKQSHNDKRLINRCCLSIPAN